MKNKLLLNNIILTLNLIVIFIGIAVLIGWKFNIPSLTSVLPNQITMKTNTAIGMIICSCSIIFLSLRLNSYRYGVIFSVFVVLAIATLTLIEYLFQFDIGIDQIIINNQKNVLNAARMSPTTAFCFLNITIAIIFTSLPINSHFRKSIVGALSTTVIIISGIIFFSYMPNILYGYKILNGASMGIHTAFAFMLLGFSLYILIYIEGKFTWVLNPLLTCGFFISLVLIVFATDAYQNFSRTIRKNDEMIIQNQQILKQLSIIAINLSSLESNENNFLLTNEKKYINNRNIYINAIIASLEKADLLIPNSAKEQLLIDKLKYLLKKRIGLTVISFNQIIKLELNNEIYVTLDTLQKEIDYSFITYINKQNIIMHQTLLISPLSIFSVITLLSLGIFMFNTNMQGIKKIQTIRRQLSEIVNSSNDGIISKDLNGIITSWNSGAEQIFGYTAKEMIGRHISILFPDDKINEESDISQRIEKGEKIEHFETIRKRKDGKSINVSVSISPLKNDKDEIIGASKIVRDITENKRLEQQLRQSNKMVAIGELSGGIAHDFNNLLGIIIGNLDLLARSIAGNEDISKRVSTTLKAATRGADLTKRLLAFSRQQPLTPEPANLNNSVNNLVEMAKQILGNNIEIETELTTDLPPVLVDIAELESALLNLIVNARDAMPDGGKVIISTRLRELDDRYPSVQTREILPGLYAALSVTDTGEGIPPEILDRVYEPFFTTKERGKGTGMGLSMIYGFAKQSGGAVKIYSEVHHGTNVTIYLPLANNIQPSYKTITQNHQVLTHTKILIVDDEPDLLEIAATYLKENGYDVYTAINGMNAIEILKSTPDIAVLLTDVVMPGGLNGVELAKKVRQLKPDIVVVYVSGFPLSKLTDEKSTKVEGLFLSKPYQRDELISTIQHALNNKG